MLQDSVADNEILFRCVQRQFVKYENGRVRLSSEAFGDRQCRPSVDRARLCNNDPSYSQVDKASDYVAQLTAEAVRNISTVVQVDANGKQIRQHQIDVEPKPTPDNPAHAEIYSKPPEFANDRVFRRLKARLAELSRWTEGFGPPDSQ